MLSVKATILAAVSATAIQDDDLFDLEYQTIKEQFNMIFDGEDYEVMEELFDDLWGQYYWLEPEPVIEEPVIEEPVIEEPGFPIYEPEPVIDEPEPSLTCQ